MAKQLLYMVGGKKQLYSGTLNTDILVVCLISIDDIQCSFTQNAKAFI